MESNGRIINEKLMAADLEGSCQEQTEALQLQVLGETEDNHENLESELPTPRSTSRIRVCGIIPTPVLYRNSSKSYEEMCV
jgi:hypothetical protein